MLVLPRATRAARQMVDLRRRFSSHPHASCALSKGNGMPNPAAGLRGPTHPAEAVLLYIVISSRLQSVLVAWDRTPTAAA